ncbi:hypothetical protein A2V68_01370 [candidate division Kazan bacterium RBG_13_50_9]|uniref:Aminoglycoside phosphotransferase domain-containing protein n=1 Tax=candidate division Kazan bacterium RBG_13_50_9 TaxID=1798535 RepID=A0A1F4NSM2_UNCK3|nr:MAG: hypothetical protein A2V68_01370 [candidate division Kazan bacterium RBG_13_50_9]
MIERGPQGNTLDQICGELGVTPVAQFRGGEKLPLGEEAATMYLVEGPERKLKNLKVGNFNEDEARKTNWLRERLAGSKLARVPEVLREESGRYILFEHVNGLPLSRESFWKMPSVMDRSFMALSEIDQVLNQEPLSNTEVQEGRDWVRKKLESEWVEPILQDAELTRGGLFTPEFIHHIQSYAGQHQDKLGDIVRIWRDPNGDHMIVPYDTTDRRMGIVDIDIGTRPRHYMPMRLLAWSLLRMADDKLLLETWVRNNREQQHLGAEVNPTFVLSLVGILYDLATGEKDNKSKRLIAIEVKNIIREIIDGSQEEN